MATFAPGYQGRLYSGGYDVSAYFNSADVQDQIMKLETTAFGNTAKQYTPGLAEGAVKAAGFFSGLAGEVNAILHAQLGTAGEPCTYYPATDVLAGAAYLLKARTVQAAAKSAVGGMVTTDAEWVADGGVAYGLSLRALAAASVTGAGTAVDGGAATTTGWRATLHVTAESGTGGPTLAVKLQDSPDNVTFTDVTGGGFTTATGITGQILFSAAATTALARYVKIVYTITGSGPAFTFAVAVARKK